MRERGIITRYFDGRRFGFIRSASLPDHLFFHASQVGSDEPERNQVKPGALVEFQIRTTPKGLRAVDVLLI
jgi:cold shock CspA family protein